MIVVPPIATLERSSEASDVYNRKGGGSTKDNGVYAVIKILEITFNETLGFPNKLCSSNGMYACNSRSRAKEWMNYLEINNHLKNEHNQPVSFAYE